MRGGESADDVFGLAPFLPRVRSVEKLPGDDGMTYGGTALSHFLTRWQIGRVERPGLLLDTMRHPREITAGSCLMRTLMAAMAYSRLPLTARHAGRTKGDIVLLNENCIWKQWGARCLVLRKVSGVHLLWKDIRLCSSKPDGWSSNKKTLHFKLF